MSSPLTPPDCDLRDFPRMMLDVARLRGSAFDATLDDSAWRAGLNLWMAAWHQVPAASLEHDDAALTKAAGLGRDLKAWRKVKATALRGWVLAEDGLLYHETLAEFALEAWIDKLGNRLSSAAGNAKRYGHEFDPAALYADIRRAAQMLALLNDKSRSLTKQHVLKAIKDGPTAAPRAPDALPADLPVGAPAGVPLASQGNGKERKGLDIDADSASADRDDLDATWMIRLAEAHVAGGEGLSLTTPALHIVRDLRQLCEPASGEPCTWPEVLDAIRMCAARAKSRGKPIRSWLWVREDAIALRDRRLNSNLPAPKAPHEQPHPRQSNTRQAAYVDRLGDIDAAMAAAFQPGGGGD